MCSIQDRAHSECEIGILAPGPEAGRGTGMDDEAARTKWDTWGEFESRGKWGRKKRKQSMFQTSDEWLLSLPVQHPQLRRALMCRLNLMNGQRMGQEAVGETQHWSKLRLASSLLTVGDFRPSEVIPPIFISSKPLFPRVARQCCYNLFSVIAKHIYDIAGPDAEFKSSCCFF